jgi:hypothetical protein
MTFGSVGYDHSATVILGTNRHQWRHTGLKVERTDMFW